MDVDIGNLLSSSPDIRHGRPRIAGTGITVHRIAIMYNKLGYSPEDIIRNYPHLNLAGVHAALAYYHANQTQLDAEIEAEEREAEQAEREFLAAQRMAS